jgi:hypothetical protein
VGTQTPTLAPVHRARHVGSVCSLHPPASGRSPSVGSPPRRSTGPAQTSSPLTNHIVAGESPYPSTTRKDHRPQNRAPPGDTGTLSNHKTGQHPSQRQSRPQRPHDPNPRRIEANDNNRFAGPPAPSCRYCPGVVSYRPDCDGALIREQGFGSWNLMSVVPSLTGSGHPWSLGMLLPAFLSTATPTFLIEGPTATQSSSRDPQAQRPATPSPLRRARRSAGRRRSDSFGRGPRPTRR